MSTTLPKARSFPWFAWLLVLLMGAGGAGAGYYLLKRPMGAVDLGTVREIRITEKPGLDLTKLKENFFSPDYYLEIYTDLGTVRTKTADSTPVGNGITFAMPVPLRLADITQIKARDENTMRKDATVDRIDHPGRETDGEKFHFQLVGEVPNSHRDNRLAWGLVIAGGGFFLLAVIRFVSKQVI